MQEPPIDHNKRYFTIGEVAKMFDVSASQIRFWEGEFEVLKPHKNSKGDRRFTQQNIDQLRLIHHLVKERGFTLVGAKQEIKKRASLMKKKAEVLEKLKSIRTFLDEVKDLV